MQPPIGGCSFAPGCVPELVYILVVLRDLGIFYQGGHRRIGIYTSSGLELFFSLSSHGAVAPSRAIDVSNGSVYGDSTYEEGPNREKIYPREEVHICAPFFFRTGGCVYFSFANSLGTQ